MTPETEALVLQKLTGIETRLGTLEHRLFGDGQPGELARLRARVRKLEAWFWRCTGAAGLLALLHEYGNNGLRMLWGNVMGKLYTYSLFTFAFLLPFAARADIIPGGPVLMVHTFSGATAGAKVVNCLAALPASGGTCDCRGFSGTQTISSNPFAGVTKPFTLLWGTATYEISAFLDLSTSNVTLRADAGGKLQAVAGIGANPLLNISGSAADITIEGGVFDANSQAAIGIQVANQATRITFRNVEVKGTTTGPGMEIAPDLAATSGVYEVNVYDSYIHDTFGPCVRAQRIGVVRLARNRCATVTSGHGLQGGGQQLMQAVDNKISGVSNAGGGATGLYCFGCDKVDWRGNEITSSYRGMHCDTCGSGNVRGNLVDSADHWGIHVEKVSNFSVHDNEVRNSGTTVGSDGIALTGTDSISINVLDATAGLTASANVTLTADAADKQEGAASVQAAIAAGFTTGTVFYQDFGATQTSFLNPFKDLWIKSDVAVASGVLSLGTSTSAACSTFQSSLKIPFIPAATWVRLQVYIPNWQYYAQTIGIRCWGIIANSDPGVVTLHFDDFDSAARNIGDVVSNNRVYWPNGPCFNFGDMIGGEIRGNYCEDPEYAASVARRAYNFAAAASPIASDNDARFTAKTPTQAGKFFILDATSTVIEANNRGTNVDTFADVTAGGKLLRVDLDASAGTVTIQAAGVSPTLAVGASPPAGSRLHVSDTPSAQITVDATGAEPTNVQVRWLKAGALKWAVLVPNSSSDLRFNDGVSDRATFTPGGVLDMQTGFRVGGAATVNRCLRADGTNFIQSAADCPTISSTDTLTNKTLDAEGAGNVVTLPAKLWLPAATCNNTTPGAVYSIPTTAPVVAAICFGTSPQRFAALDFTDAANANTVTTLLTLPPDINLALGVDIKLVWFSGSTSTNSVVLTVATACVADGEDLLAPTFNATQTVADANNATANSQNSASITGVTTTGCAAGEMLFLRLGRDATNASDTLAATASLLGVELTYRRAM